MRFKPIRLLQDGLPKADHTCPVRLFFCGKTVRIEVIVLVKRERPVPERYSKNVPGDFYVETGCCITCGVPMGEAPEFFEMDDDQCYIVKQPASQEERISLVDAIGTQEVGCIRYAGTDRKVMERMRDKGDIDCCDSPLALDLIRTIVTFAALDDLAGVVAGLCQTTEREIAEWPYRKLAVDNFQDADVAILRLSWAVDCVLALEIRALRADHFKLTCLRDQGVSHYASSVLHGLLSRTFSLTDIRWMTPFEWDNGLGNPEP